MFFHRAWHVEQMSESPIFINLIVWVPLWFFWFKPLNQVLSILFNPSLFFFDNLWKTVLYLKTSYPSLFCVDSFVIKIDVKGLLNKILKLLRWFVLDILYWPKLLLNFFAHGQFCQRMIMKWVHFMKLKKVFAVFRF